MSHQPQRPHEQQEAPPSAWEWFVAAIGLLLLAGSIGYLAYDALAADGASPAPAGPVVAIGPQERRFLGGPRNRKPGASWCGWK